MFGGNMSLPTTLLLGLACVAMFVENNRRRTAKEDLEDSQELVEQQAMFTDTWQGKFEELKELAKSNGTPLAAILEIQDRKVGAK